MNSKLNPHRQVVRTSHTTDQADPAPPSKPQITLHIIIKKPKISEKSLAASAAMDDMNLSCDVSLEPYSQQDSILPSPRLPHTPPIPLLFREKKKTLMYFQIIHHPPLFLRDSLFATLTPASQKMLWRKPPGTEKKSRKIRLCAQERVQNRRRHANNAYAQPRQANQPAKQSVISK